ncbi:MAG: hypothetical protein ACI3W5_15340 [Faecousia sp.]
MKKFIKGILFLLVITSVLAVAFGLTGCSAGFSGNDIAKTINESVTMPEQYSITYEVESASGEIHTVQKMVDSEGNTYFKDGAEELLFIKEENNYALYQKDADGCFTTKDGSAVYNSTYVKTSTAAFLTYAERSKKQFIPGMNESGEKEVLGRTCLVYSVGVGAEDTGVTYSVLVDKETGICMGWEEAKAIFGHDVGIDGENFTCTEFLTEDIPSLRTLLGESEN